MAPTEIAEITRADTAERARLIRVHSCDISLDLCRGTELFGSTSLIRFNCSRPGASSYLDLVAEMVREIRLNGEPLDPALAYDSGRIALTGLAASNEVVVVADCAYRRDGSGMHRAVDSEDGTTYLYTSLEPAMARYVYACFEQPDLKAPFTFHVTAPAHWTVLSNEPAPAPQPAREGAAVWNFPATPPLPTYVTSIVAGDYHLVTGTHTTPAGQVIPVGLACRASLAGHLDAADVFAVTGQGLDYFTGLFAGSFPFRKYDQVFVPEYFSGATENAGCVIITDDMLFRSRVTETMYELRAEVILHEMAHMWFGDMVTMRWWDDLWLNESFAEYCGAAATAEATRFTRAWTTFSSGRKNWAYSQDQLPSTHPIAASAQSVTEAIGNFDGISYAKGASVLKQLVAYVGRDAFFAGVRAYFAEHAWNNATLTDLVRAVEAAAGRDLTDWSKAWLESAGVNTLRADFEVDEHATFTSFAVLQEAQPGHPTLRPQRVAIGLYRRSGGTLARVHRVEVDIAGERTAVPGLAGLSRPDLILLNDDDLGYALTRFDSRSLRTLTDAIGELTDSLARSVCLGSAIDMARQAEMSLPSFVTMVAGGMSGEPSVSVLQILLFMTRQLIETFGDPEWVPTGTAQLATSAMRLLRAAEPASDFQLAWAQLLASTATADDQLDLVAGLLDGTTSMPGLAVDTDLRWGLLGRLAATGRAGDAEIDAEVLRDPTDAGRRHAAACRASIPDAARKAAAWQLLTEDADVAVDTMTEVASAFNRPEQSSLLAPYAERYLEVLPRIWSTRGEHFRSVFGVILFPYWAASPGLLESVGAVLAQTTDPGLARLLSERRDVVERALRSRLLTE
jgi:aminopeptidase N